MKSSTALCSSGNAYALKKKFDKTLEECAELNVNFEIMIVYGIPNCNTVKKARVWLEENDLSFEFHDFKKKGISAEKLNEWCDTFGWEVVLNKKGTTWKNLDPDLKESVTDQQTAIVVMLQNNSAIKRPIVEVAGKSVLISYSEEQYISALK